MCIKYQGVNVLHQQNQPLIGIQKFYALSYTWYALFGILTTYIIGIIVSLIFSKKIVMLYCNIFYYN